MTSEPPRITLGCPPLDSQSYETYVDIEGTGCYVAITRYSNRALVVVSSKGTLGSIVHAQKDMSLRGGLTYGTHMALGNRSDEIPELCARMIVEAMDTKHVGSVPIVLCLGATLRGREQVSKVVDHVIQGFQSILHAS